MRKLLLVLTLALTTGIGLAGMAPAAPAPSAAPFTCAYFQDPTVELVWSHVCHF